MSLKDLGVSYKPQHLETKATMKSTMTVARLLEKKCQAGLQNTMFRQLVMKPLKVDELMPLQVATLSGGELQRLAISMCLAQPATIYLIDEPSAGLDSEQRIMAAQVIKRWVNSYMQKTAFIVEHDLVMTASLAERVIVYSGRPGVEATACSPTAVVDGFNGFLKNLDVTVRREMGNLRPRINKLNSGKDRDQKAAGQYFMLEAGQVEKGKKDADSD